MSKITISNLKYSYSQNDHALNGVTLEVDEGSFISIVGHNGSGKSTLAKALVGLIKPKSGEIIIDGVKLQEDTLSILRKKIAIVFQNPDNQFIGSTVEDDIAFGLENRNTSYEDMHKLVLEYAKKVHLEKYLDKEPISLSGGQKQRVAIAGVLALHPDILILDEATAMLDPKGRKDIYDLLIEMRKENPSMTIISITHQVEEAYLTDKVYVMKNGEIVHIGTPNEIFSDDALIKRNGLKKPFLLELKEACKNHDINIDDIKTIEEASEILCQYK